MKVVNATFPTEQDLGQTSLMRIGVRNTGDKTVPALDGHDLDRGQGRRRPRRSPSAIHDPQPDLAQPDRPVWVLAEGYPEARRHDDEPRRRDHLEPQDLRLRRR